MKAVSFLFVATLLLAALPWMPSAAAVGTCTFATDPSCGDLACVGYSNGRWQTCYPRDLIPRPPPCTVVAC